jgi:acyl-CoA dehydrogenase
MTEVGGFDWPPPRSADPAEVEHGAGSGSGEPEPGSGEPVEPADPDLVEMIQAVFRAGGPTERGVAGGIGFDQVLWERLDTLGLARLTTPPDRGGSGAGWREAAVLLGAAAAHAVALPLAEHDLLAGWLLTRAGLPADAQLRTVALLSDVSTPGLGRTVSALAVPWARYARRIVVAWPASDPPSAHRTQPGFIDPMAALQDVGDWYVAEVAATEVALTPGRNLAGEPRDTIVFDAEATSGPSVQVAGAVVAELLVRGALARAVAVSAALDRIVTLTHEHASTRRQFGRPVAAFQAVAHLIADLAAEAALAAASVGAAVRAADDPGVGFDQLAFAVAVARSCSGHAASVVVRNGHQVHGAIGTTLEHQLHRFALPALAWRSEFGSTRFWDERVAAAARRAGPDGLWSLLVDETSG